MKNRIYPRVLYAEGDKDGCLMISTMLGFSGIEVQAVNTAAEAIRLARTEHFDLYLLDTRFPEGSGFELCRKLRETVLQTPIIFYSGEAYTADKARGIFAGADAYLVKPDSDTIAATIFRLLKENRKRVSPKL
jgi:DNA-binding response OmpR family regulator